MLLEEKKNGCYKRVPCLMTFLIERSHSTGLFLFISYSVKIPNPFLCKRIQKQRNKRTFSAEGGKVEVEGEERKKGKSQQG